MSITELKQMGDQLAELHGLPHPEVVIAKYLALIVFMLTGETPERRVMEEVCGEASGAFSAMGKFPSQRQSLAVSFVRSKQLIAQWKNGTFEIIQNSMPPAEERD